jgi:hypothetical protein
VPKNLTASTHVNVLQMNFGHRRELLALMLDAPGGCVAVAARATALDGQDGKYYYTFTAPPGDYQLPENVPPDLVNNFAVAFDARSATQGVCRLIVRAWDGEAREAPALADALQAQPAADNLAAAQLHPLMAAALYAEGWRASSDPQPQTLFLGVKQEALFFDLRATWYLGNRGSCTVTHRRIRGEQLFDSLRILFQHASAWQAGVKECINLGLAATAMRLATMAWSTASAWWWRSRETVLRPSTPPPAMRSGPPAVRRPSPRRPSARGGCSSNTIPGGCAACRPRTARRT